MNKKTALIIGAGPAGLTCALDLLAGSDIKPVIFEADVQPGGISKTVNYKGNRIDIGGHRFFSKSDRVMDRWLDTLPLQSAPACDDLALGRDIFTSFAAGKTAGSADPEKTDGVMLARRRVSHILFGRKFYTYPVSLSAETVRNLGLVRMVKIGLSYMAAKAAPIRPENSLEDFFINRFGRELYATFFEDYTRKVWGRPCSQLKPEWGAQRVKGLSIMGVLLHAVKKIFSAGAAGGDIRQKDTETTLIERYLYPKYGPGQLWERTAELVLEKGGELHYRRRVTGVLLKNGRAEGLKVLDLETNTESEVRGDFVVSTMPVRELIAAMPESGVPQNVREVAAGLEYRDFLTAGFLLRRLKMKNTSPEKTVNDILPDTWIYVQERDVLMGRIQIFNNWSPYLVAEPGNVWLGTEFFANEGDDFWRLSDREISAIAAGELEKIGVADRADILDSTIVRSRKTYPVYYGTYERFSEIREFTDGIANLFLIGRNGMHRYNNMDHSMLSAMTAAENMMAGVAGKSNIWAVNTEQEYHEEKKN
ncbi:MAG: NAD(P)/FAD-dependent oxidoreductase [Elusimicrobiaceae bacterium]|nr:NAD(P)/FAD-dependent oxidoreductase [Elusimicrobiaceae bacterium]